MIQLCRLEAVAGMPLWRGVYGSASVTSDRSPLKSLKVINAVTSGDLHDADQVCKYFIHLQRGHSVPAIA